MSTAAIARDVVELFERHGQWREDEARQLCTQGQLSSEETGRILHQTAYQPGAEMVQYWGFSYGTVLGATLSAMYPERIHRAVLDGVSDSHDYMAGGWFTNLRDTDKLLEKLAEYCFSGGKENCALWHGDGPTAIVETIKNTLNDMKHNPIGVPGSSTAGPTLVTYSDLKN